MTAVDEVTDVATGHREVRARRRRPKDIGTACETAVVNYLRGAGFPGAERRALAGAYDLGDIVGTPGVVWEVKGGKAAEAAGDGQVLAWLEETDQERVNARADVGVLVMKRRGAGVESVGRWWAVVHFVTVAPELALLDRQLFVAPVRMHLRDVVQLLRGAGYGTALEPSPLVVA